MNLKTVITVFATALLLSGCGFSDDQIISVLNLSLNKNNTIIVTGGSEQLIATITPSNATNQNVSWSSSNSSIATVSTGGLVSAVSAGSASITATTADGGYTATCTVTVVSCKIVYKFGSYSGSYSNIYVIWLENSSENFYYPVYICNRLLGIGGALTNTALPYWKVNKYPLMNSADVDAVTGATVKKNDFNVPFDLPAGAPRQFTVYFETDVSYNPNDWFGDQPAILYKADIDLDNIQPSYTLSYCGWTPNEGTVGVISGTVMGTLNTVLEYITNLKVGAGFGGVDPDSQTNLVESITVYVNP